jgi:hypothetical protein
MVRRRGIADLVPMPLPTEYGVVSLPPGASTPAPLPAGSSYGFQQVLGGWILAVKNFLGQITPVPGAPVLDSPGGQPINTSATPPYGGTPSQGNQYPTAPPSSFPGASFGGGVRVHNPTSGPRASWGRQAVIPNSQLPLVLQRTNPLLRQTTYHPNGWDASIKKHSAMWDYIKSHGGIKSCCRIPELGAPVYDNPPWMVQPSQGEKFEEMFSVATGSITPGVDTVLGSFTVDNGYDGAINRFVAGFNGNGFVDFSGSIVWRLLINNRYARTLGNVVNTFGDYATAFSVPGSDNIRLVSQQTVSLIANIPVGSPVSDGFVSAGVFGWLYPRR